MSLEVGFESLIHFCFMLGFEDVRSQDSSPAATPTACCPGSLL